MLRNYEGIGQEIQRPGIWLDEVPIPDIGINDVRIKIRKTSICGTDIHIYKWNEWAQKTINTPMVIGHEFVGVVDAVGSNVHDFKPVTGFREGHVVCGLCRNCMAGGGIVRDTNGIG